MSATPTFQEALEAAIANGIARVRVAMPGKVTKYDSTRETVNVLPQLKTPLVDELGEYEFEDLPIIPDVPIMWPSGNGGECFITFPIAEGDYVELVFNDFDIGVWRTQGEQGNPGDLRIHGLSGAVAYPGLRTNATKLGSGKVHAENVVIGAKVMLGNSTLDVAQTGALNGESIDPYTGMAHWQLGNASQSVFVKKT
jgi:hypothetical protein